MSARLRSERGVALMEALIAAALLSMTLIVFIGGLSTGLLTTGQSDRLSTAHELARSQVEYTKDIGYVAAPHTYPSVTAPATYGVTSTASVIAGGDANVQLITVQVTKDGNPVFSLEDYKVKR